MFSLLAALEEHRKEKEMEKANILAAAVKKKAKIRQLKEFFVLTRMLTRLKRTEKEIEGESFYQ